MMLEELIEEYIAAKAKYEGLKGSTGTSLLPQIRVAASEQYRAGQNLLDWIEHHQSALISWERQHALRLSPFEDPE